MSSGSSALEAAVLVALFLLPALFAYWKGPKGGCVPPLAFLFLGWWFGGVGGAGYSAIFWLWMAAWAVTVLIVFEHRRRGKSH